MLPGDLQTENPNKFSYKYMYIFIRSKFSKYKITIQALLNKNSNF